MKRILKWTGILATTGSIIAATVALMVIKEANIAKVFSEVAPISEDSELINLEQDSIVRSKDLETFHLFTNEVNELDSKLKKINKNQYLVVEKVELLDLNQNDCEFIYCYQNRIAFGKIPSIFWRGLIGIEDYRFISHIGIDLKAILRALVKDILAMRFVEGGSTLTQQLVKNLFYSGERSISRKLKELVLAIYIEMKYSKEKILQSYFNEVYWGAFQGIRVKGIYSAVRFYFSKRVDEVSEYESSILIALLKGPNFYHPIRHTERLRNRVDFIFNKLKGLSHIRNSAEKWNDEDWRKWVESLKLREDSRPYYAVWETLEYEEEGLNSFEKFILIKGVHEIRRKFSGANIGIKIAIGEVGSNSPPMVYYSKYERDRKKATEEEAHQIGSIFKPIIYSIFHDLGVSYTESIETGPITLKLKSGDWSPRDAVKNIPAKVLVFEALLKSLNRPLVRLYSRLESEKVEERLKNFLPEMKSPLSEYPSQLIGAAELSIIEVFSTYRSFIESECKKPADSSSIALLSDPSQTTIRFSVREDLKKMRFFGKTGTTNKGKDNWFVGYDGRMLGVIWVGKESFSESEKYNLFGSRTAFPIYQNFLMNRGKLFNQFECGR